MRPSSLTLYELNNLIRELLETQLAHRFWVTAEINEIRTAGNQHCYLTLIENSDDGNDIIARASAHIWRNTHFMIRRKFQHATGQDLSNGMKVLVEVEIDFHEVYGYSLNITDIDPTYTLGDAEKRRQEILQKLENDGIIDLNKGLNLPRILTKIAVITSETAAGYGDFLHQITQTGFPFHCELFPAVMQGPKTEESIIDALNKINRQKKLWDAVVIIRGGGASSDLWAFDSYALAENVANFPLPVITGIGHERDKSILDFVAHTSLKTPTAVAAFLIDRFETELALLEDFEVRLHDAAAQIIKNERQRLEITGHRLHSAALQVGRVQEERLLLLKTKISLHVRQHISDEHRRLERIPLHLRHYSQGIMQQEKNRMNEIGKSLTLLDPKNVLQRGYSITLQNGKAVKDAGTLKQGSILVTHFAKGQVESRVEHIKKKA